MPTGTAELIGLGLNYCVKPATIAEMTESTFQRLAKDIGCVYALRGVEDGGNYIPSLCLESDWEFKVAPNTLKMLLQPSKMAF